MQMLFIMLSSDANKDSYPGNYYTQHARRILLSEKMHTCVSHTVLTEGRAENRIKTTKRFRKLVAALKCERRTSARCTKEEV